MACITECGSVRMVIVRVRSASLSGSRASKTCFQPRSHISTSSARRWRRFKFRVAVAVRLLAIGGEKIGPTRTHIPRRVFHDDGDGIGFWVKGRKKPLVGTLGYRPFPQFLVVTKNFNGIFQVRGGELVRHSGILSHVRGLSSP